MLKLYVCIYAHRFGTSVFPFYCATHPTEQMLIELCETETGCAFEKERDETVEAVELNLQETPTIK